MGEIIKRQANGAPAPVTPETARLTIVMKNRLEAAGTTKTGTDLSSISSQNAPTESQRAALTRRSMQLADALAPKLSDREDVADAILEMFYAWPDTRRMDAGKAAATASKYAATVSDLPLWAIKKACDQLTREDRDFPPSAGTLRATAFKACSVEKDELADLRRILTAEIYTPTKHGPEAIRVVNELAASFARRLQEPPPVRRRNTNVPSRFDDSRGYDPNKPVAPSDELIRALSNGS